MEQIMAEEFSPETRDFHLHHAPSSLKRTCLFMLFFAAAIFGCADKKEAGVSLQIPRGYVQVMEIEVDGRRVRVGPFVGYYFQARKSAGPGPPAIRLLQRKKFLHPGHAGKRQAFRGRGNSPDPAGYRPPPAPGERIESSRYSSRTLPTAGYRRARNHRTNMCIFIPATTPQGRPGTATGFAMSQPQHSRTTWAAGSQKTARYSIRLRSQARWTKTSPASSNSTGGLPELTIKKNAERKKKKEGRINSASLNSSYSNVPLMTLLMTDPTGKAMFVQFVNLARTAGEGWVEYMRPKPGQSTPAKKLSYTYKVPNHDLFVGTGVYVGGMIY